MSPHHINPAQWQQAMGYARQACARIFRDGGTPAEACRAFGLTEERPPTGASPSTASRKSCARRPCARRHRARRQTRGIARVSRSSSE